MTDQQAQTGAKKDAQQGVAQGVWSTTHTLFLGEYTHKMDRKGRLALPAKFRAKLQNEGAVVTRGNEHCLYLYSIEAWKPLAEKLAKLPSISNPAARKVQRELLGGATPVTPDRQGRILLSNELRKHAGLVSDASQATPVEAVVVGLYDRIEIWLADRWQRQHGESDLDALGPELEKLGI